MSSRVSLNRILAVTGLLTLGACESVGNSFDETFEDIVDQDGYNFSAQLRGASELAGGDPDGTGVAHIPSAIRATWSASTCRSATSARSPPRTSIADTSRVNGGPMVTLDPPDDDRRDDCIALDKALSDDIRHNPTGFYVNVHTAEFPNGAVRGQISQLVN